MPLIILITMNTPAHAGVIEYTDKQAWQNAVPSYSTIDFTSFPDGLAITDQYAADHGLTFAPGSFYFHSSGFPSDGEGVLAQPGSRLYFDEPRHSLAVDFGGSIVISLFYKEELVYTSSEFFSFNSTFAGLVSDAPFDEAYFYRIISPGFAAYDNLYFGPPIPAPGGLALLGLAALGARARRRRSL